MLPLPLHLSNLLFNGKNLVFSTRNKTPRGKFYTPTMSKKCDDEHDWEEADEEYEEDEEEEDTTINNSDVVMRYKKAAAWANETLKELIDATKPGVKVYDLCVMGDELMEKKLKTMFKGTEKGIAFPTSISLNNCVCHNSPSSADENPQIIALNDVVHYDLGVQVDGYCAQVAHTIQVTENSELGSDEKATRVITAAYNTIKTAMRKMRPGCTVNDITNIIEKAAEHYQVTPVEGVLSHMVKRYIIDGFRCIPQKKSPDHAVYNYDLDKAQVWCLDVVMTTGKGKLKEKDVRPSIFKVSLDSTYNMKMDTSKELEKEIDAKFKTFPFAIRNLTTKKARLGLNEMLKHDSIFPYPVLYEREGEVVAHFKMTVLINNKKIEPITGINMQKGPALEPFADEELLQASKMPLSLEEKKKKA